MPSGFYQKGLELVRDGKLPENNYTWAFDSSHDRVTVFQDGVAVLWFSKPDWDGIRAGRYLVMLNERDVTEMIRAIPELGT